MVCSPRVLWIVTHPLRLLFSLPKPQEACCRDDIHRLNHWLQYDERDRETKDIDSRERGTFEGEWIGM